MSTPTAIPEVQITWNLFLSLIAFPLLYWMIKGVIGNFFKAWEKNAKELHAKVDALSACMTGVKIEVAKKVDIKDCDHKMEKSYDTIRGIV